MRSEINFFTPFYFSHENKSHLQTASEYVEAFFDYGLNRYTVIKGLSKKGRQCVQSTPADHPNYILIAVKISFVIGTACYLLKGARVYHNPSLTMVLEVTTSVTEAMLTLKVASRLFLLSSYHVIDSKYDLIEAKKIVEEDIEITSEMIAKVQSVWNTKDQSASWINSKVFTLDEYPDYIFKHAPDEQLFINILISQAVCIGKLLTLIVIPHSKHFNLDSGATIVVQQRLPVIPDAANQEYFYQKYGDRLEPAFMEAKEYVIATEESDYVWRNVVVYDEDPENKAGPLKLAAIDHDLRESADWGLYGHDKLDRRGLIRCLPEKQARKVAATLPSSKAEKALQDRLEELRKDEALQEHYRQKNISEGNRQLAPLATDKLKPQIRSQVTQLYADIKKNLEKRNPASYFSLKGLRQIHLEYRFNDPHLHDVRTRAQKYKEALEFLKNRGIIFDYSYREKIDKKLLSLPYPEGFVTVIQA